MIEYPIQHYFPTFSKLVGHNLHANPGILILLVSLLLASLCLHFIINAASEKSHSYISSFLFVAAIIMISPLFIMMADISLDVYFDDVSLSTRQYTGLFIACVGVGVWPMTRLYNCSFLTSLMAVLPSIALWVMLIFTLNFVEEQIDSSEMKTQKIRGRTIELDSLINP